VKIIALGTEYIVHERYINATRCLNIILQVKEAELGGACNMHREKMNASRILVGKSECRPRHRWEDNI
jgi:hypothetical protein